MGEGGKEQGKKRKEGPGSKSGKKGTGSAKDSGKNSAADKERKKSDALPGSASSSGRGKENATPSSDPDSAPSLEAKGERSDAKAGARAAGAGTGVALAGAGAAAAAAAAALGAGKQKEGQASGDASGDGKGTPEGGQRNSRRKSFSPDGKEVPGGARASGSGGEEEVVQSPFEKEQGGKEKGEGQAVRDGEAHSERPLFTGPIQPPSPPMGPSIVEIPGTGTWLRFSWLTQRGYYPEAPGKANQDSFCVVPQYGGAPGDFLFGVYDGHGEHGTPCSQFSRDRLAENLLKHPLLNTDVAAAFRDAFVETNVELHQSPIDDTMSGSTGIAVLMRNNTLYAANVGDSRAVLAQWMGPTGAEDGAREGEERLVAVDLSSDQTPFRADECERVKACGARVLTLDQLEGLKDPNVQCWGGEEDDDGDPPRLWVQSGMYPGTAFTRSVGDSVAEKIGVSAEPEIMAVDVSPHTHPFFVIASDGVFEFLSSQDVVDMVRFQSAKSELVSPVARTSTFLA